MPFTKPTRGARRESRAARDERRSERRQEIVRAAVRAFSRYGYHACTVGRVAEEAGVADGTIYLYFPSKEALLIGAFQDVLGEMLERLDRELEAFGDPLAKLRRMVELHLELLGRDPELAAFLQIQLRQPDEAIRKAISGPLGAYARRIEAVLDRAKELGALEPRFETRLLRRVIFGAIDETVSAWCLRPGEGALADRAGPLLEVLLQGMVPRPQG